MQSIRLLFALALLAPVGSWACGGFFCSTFPMDQVSERILFVADQGQVTTHVQLEFNGNAPDFAWILPVPAVPALEVSHNEIFRQLQFATQPSFFLEFQEGGCDDFWPPFARSVEMASAEDAADDGVQVVSEERIGPYDTAVITSENADAIAQWLTDNGYNLDELGSELLKPYVDEGFFFLALRLAPDREVGDLQPIALTYAADKPAIPIRLTAVATQPDLGVLVWVLGEHRAIPQNYLHVQINEARIDWFNGGFNYNEVVSEAADEADGQAFATDYAGSSKIMGDRLYQEGRYDLDALRIIEDPPTFVSTLLRQGFPRDNQMQALLRRHIPMPPAVLEEGVLEIVFGGDQKAYDSALADGFLQSIAESSFYNNMEAYTAYLDEIDFAPDLFADALAETIVEPLRRSQVLFAEHPFLTRLFTTLSASEMTLDPVFSFNPDLPPVDNVRTAQAHWECPNGDPEEIPPEDIVLIITLNDGRQIRTNPFNGVEPIPLASAGPAARLIERLEDSGPPILIRRPTDITEESGNETLPLTTALLPNYPNPFNSGTVIPFQVPDITADTRVSLHIFNLLGQPVRRLLQERTRPGLHQVSWDGHNDQGHAVPSGVYIYRLDVGTQRHTRKLLLLR